MSTQTTPKRSLADLTAQECQTLFTATFSYPPQEDRFDISHVLDLLSFGDETHGITLGTNGRLLAWRSGGNEPVWINAQLLISTLDAMNVAFGPCLYQPTQQIDPVTS